MAQSILYHVAKPDILHDFIPIEYFYACKEKTQWYFVWTEATSFAANRAICANRFAQIGHLRPKGRYPKASFGAPLPRLCSLPPPTSSSSFNSAQTLVAHDCGYPLSRYTCRTTRVATDFLDFIAFCRCSTGVALHPLKILVSHLAPPCPGRCRTEIWGSEKVSRYTGVSQL